MVAILFVVVSSALSLVLVPEYGPRGAAVALMVSSIVSCVAFMVLGRRWYALPVDFTALGVMPALAVLFVLGAHTAADFIPNGSAPLFVDGVVFALFGGFTVRRFGLLHATPAVVLGDAVPARVGR
jgi:peptidoglycan biosynthesis protein MviN/MurJ (putative lipid II flippase)